MAYEMTTRKNIPFSEIMNTEGAKKQIMSVLQDPKRAMRFTSSVISAVAATPALKECEPSSVISAALIGESLELSHSPQLGQFYIVPFGRTATFVMGYKGYNQLALRSGLYRRIVSFPVKKGEVVQPFNLRTEDIELSFIQDEDTRDATETVGYFAEYELMSGAKKALYWTKKAMHKHAMTYVPAYAKKSSTSRWIIDFDSMARKTMLRQLIGTWGVMSAELRQALESESGDDVDFSSMTDITPTEPTQEPKKRAAKKAEPQPIVEEDDAELPFTLSDDEESDAAEPDIPYFDLEQL